MKFTALTKIAGRAGILVKKYSPEILMVVGIAGLISSAVLACKSTLKVEEVLDNHKKQINDIKTVEEQVKNGEVGAEFYTEKDKNKDLTLTYTQTGLKLIKLYGPAVSLALASISCIVGSHGIMKKRNVALIAAYKAIEESFNAYRKRVVEDIGEEKDYIYKNGLVKAEPENDGSKKTKNSKYRYDTNGISQYARFFDETSTEWSKEKDYNFLFLRNMQNYFNDMLKVRGHVFLNEVYDALGFERTQAGAVVGWVISKDGDNFVDFGIFDGDSPKVREFVNGLERSILLDFNVDGVIYDLI